MCSDCDENKMGRYTSMYMNPSLNTFCRYFTDCCQHHSVVGRIKNLENEKKSLS